MIRKKLYAAIENRLCFLMLAISAYAIGFSYYGFYHYLKPTTHFFWFLDWISTQYYVNYFEFGFLRRALLGTFIHPFFRLFSPFENIHYLFILGMHFANFVILSWFYHVLISNLKHTTKNFKILLLSAFILSPLGASQFGFDCGRTDHYIFTLTVVAASLVKNKKYLYSSLVCCFSILIHEISIFFAIPLLVSLLHYSNQHIDMRKTWKHYVIFLSPPLAIVILLYLFGTPETGVLDTLPSAFSEGTGGYYRATFEIQQGYTYFWQKYLIIAFTALPIILLTRLYMLNKWAPDFLYFCIFIPSVLFFLGVDYARWCFIFGFTSIFIIVLKTSHLKTLPRHQIHMSPWLRLDYYLLIILLLPLGPIGIIEPLPLINGIIEMVNII